MHQWQVFGILVQMKKSSPAGPGPTPTLTRNRERCMSSPSRRAPQHNLGANVFLARARAAHRRLGPVYRRPPAPLTPHPRRCGSKRQTPRHSHHPNYLTRTLTCTRPTTIAGKDMDMNSQALRRPSPSSPCSRTISCECRSAGWRLCSLTLRVRVLYVEPDLRYPDGRRLCAVCGTLLSSPMFLPLPSWGSVRKGLICSI